MKNQLDTNNDAASAASAETEAAGAECNGKKQLLENLLQTSAVWQGARRQPLAGGLSTGYPALDSALPWKGWPEQGIVEIISTRNIGELQLLLPLLGRVTQQRRPSIWITPPFIPYAPALVQAGIATDYVFLLPGIDWKQTLWSLEKALHTPGTVALAWLNRLSIPVLRRLQLAAQTGSTLGILFHQRPVANAPSTLQLALRPSDRPGLHVRIIKARGSYHRPTVQIAFSERTGQET